MEYIYNELLAGNELMMEFPSVKEATKFRVALAKYKARNENAAVSIGLFSKAELQVLSFQKIHHDESTVKFKLLFREKTANQQFQFTILNDPDTEEVEETSDAEI